MTKKAEDKAPEAPKKQPQRFGTIVRSGFKLPDAMALQGDRQVEYELRDGKKVIVGPATLRPANLIGAEIP